MSERRFFLALTVKNEAPNLWEWVAYHRMIGFTDIAIYQNDSEDGTQKILRTMEKAGYISYFPNPSRNKGWQNKAYRRASRLEAYHAAEWAMALDCDEFLVVKTGAGQVSDLVDALPETANACTVHWKAFGSAYHANMPDGLVTEAFTLAEDPQRIGDRQMGFKSIFKPTAFRRIGIHKPKDPLPDQTPVFCNGSGQLLDPGETPGWRSKDPDHRKLAQVNHYALRDLERFLVKSGRGRTANHERAVDRTYWQTFDINDATDTHAAARANETHAEMARMDAATHGRLALLTREGRTATHEVFQNLMNIPAYHAIYTQIKADFPQQEKSTGTLNNRQLSYDTVIETNGIKIPFVPDIITPAISQPMRNNRYEGGECKALRQLLQEGDRVLELGAGVGLTSTIAALHPGVESVLAVEANPGLISLIKETYRINKASKVTLLNGIIAADCTEPTDFYLRQDFWASSIEADSRPYEEVVKVTPYRITDLMARQNPTVISCDIEGAELGLFDDVDLSEVRLLIIEFHPKVYGQDNVDRLIAMLWNKGFSAVPVEKATSVRRFVRRAHEPAEAQWPPADPKFLVATCMKDEGPFILEWVAWHKAIGVNNFVVFTNDCTDGTDSILERLQEMGYLRHLPNPALATKSTYFQPIALSYVPFLQEWKDADFFISMDVDEFINIRVGDSKLPDLLAATGFFDALSMSELNHGSNQREGFTAGLVTEQFPRHQTERPGGRKARRGVKTITRISPKLDKPRNHRPDFRIDMAPPVWRDGAGRELSSLHQDSTLNGIDVRGTYDLVVLDHFPLRSLESYLIKMFRGDVVIKNNKVSQRYWRVRNRNDELSSDFARQQKPFRIELAKLMDDQRLRTLHEEACNVHAERAKELLKQPEYIERRNWILQNAW